MLSSEDGGWQPFVAPLGYLEYVQKSVVGILATLAS